MSSELKYQTSSEILERLKADLLATGNTLHNVEGGFNFANLSANAVEFENAYAEIMLALDASFAQTSWGEYLDMRAEEHGIIRKQATQAQVYLEIKGTTGVTVPRGSLFSTETDIQFKTNAAAVISAGTVTVKAMAVIAGKSGNVEKDLIKKIPLSIPGVTAVNNPASAYDGFDLETDDALRERLLEHVRNPATSGNAQHYKEWATSVSGVGQVKVLPLWAGNGTVKVLVVDGGNNPASSDLVERVQEYIETVRPIGATVTVAAPTTKKINITANIVGTTDTIRVTEYIKSYFRSIIFTASHVSYARIGKLILDSPGVKDYSNLQVNGGTANIALGDDDLAVVGEVTLSAT